MNKLILIEQVYKDRKCSNNTLISDVLRQYQAAIIGTPTNFCDYLRQNTAEFPMRVLSHGILEELSPQSKILTDPSHPDYQKVLQFRFNGIGTPRFPTDEEIENEERRLLLTFAFKD
jgi:hypothetical protein